MASLIHLFRCYHPYPSQSPPHDANIFIIVSSSHHVRLISNLIRTQVEDTRALEISFQARPYDYNSVNPYNYLAVLDSLRLAGRYGRVIGPILAPYTQKNWKTRISSVVLDNDTPIPLPVNANLHPLPRWEIA